MIEKLSAVVGYCRCNKIECCGAALSIIGGFFSPLIDPNLRLIGFVIWFCGNVLWVHFAWANKKYGMWCMQFVFSLQNGAGIINMIFGAI